MGKVILFKLHVSSPYPKVHLETIKKEDGIEQALNHYVRLTMKDTAFKGLCKTL